MRSPIDRLTSAGPRRCASGVLVEQGGSNWRSEAVGGLHVLLGGMRNHKLVPTDEQRTA